MDFKRAFLIVLDSFGIGGAKDAKDFGDEGANTLLTISKSSYFNTPNMQKMGLFNIEGLTFLKKEVKEPICAFARLEEASKGKDTTIGHLEIAGVISQKPLPTYPNGFPEDIIKKFEQKTGKKVICNKPYSGTDVIKDYGDLHIKTGDLIVYTSADSVFQIAAHEDIVPLESLYKYCKIAREEILKGEHAVGRVIARPFKGRYPFERTKNRHDYALLPPKKTMLDYLKENNLDVISVGKINDIFAGYGITKSIPSKDNTEGMQKTMQLLKEDFKGLAFINLVDFDMLYGHRNDIEGYAKAIAQFDTWLLDFLAGMQDTDILFITADHGCDPGFKGTDHTRENVPLLIYSNSIKNISLGTRNTFAGIAKTILDIFNINANIDGTSFLKEIIK